MKNIRIVLEGNTSRLVYSKGLICEFSPPIRYANHNFGSSYNEIHRLGLASAYKLLRENIAETKQKLIESDKLAQKENGAVFKLLKQKRRVFAKQCFESKKPFSRAKHVGVEIEFICNSDRHAIALELAAVGVSQFVQLKSDGSVHGDNDGSGDCDGSCREDCQCYDCGETHYCDDERECDRRVRNYGSHNGNWEYREDCTDCTETVTIDNCDCGGQNEAGNNVCKGEHVICSGHCPGHDCAGYDDHDNWDCNCECTCGTDNGHEISIVAKSTQITDIITKVCSVLQKHDADVNSTCGLHVHLDMRGFDEKRSFANLVKTQKLLYSMVPFSRFENQYCRPNKHGFDMGVYCGRYWAINPAAYSEHKTIEVRLHSGTINAVKINHWIKLLQKIAYAKSVCQVNKLSDLTNQVKLPDDLLSYVRGRIAKFKSEHSKSDFVDDLDTANTEQLDLIAA